MTSMILIRSDGGDGGWSLHPAGYPDEQYADGTVPTLAEGEAEWVDGGWNRPTEADWAAAERKAAAAATKEDK